jgi:hypothetical protein
MVSRRETLATILPSHQKYKRIPKIKMKCQSPLHSTHLKNQQNPTLMPRSQRKRTKKKTSEFQLSFVKNLNKNLIN